MIKIKLGSKGEIVIPKKIRESLGFKDRQAVILELKDDKIEIYPQKGKEVLENWRKIVLEEGVDVRKTLLYGDRLYKRVF